MPGQTSPAETRPVVARIRTVLKKRMVGDMGLLLLLLFVCLRAT